MRFTASSSLSHSQDRAVRLLLGHLTLIFIIWFHSSSSHWRMSFYQKRSNSTNMQMLHHHIQSLCCSHG